MLSVQYFNRSRQIFVNLCMQFRFLCFIYLTFIAGILKAQPSSYPQDYFRNPLEIPIQLSANFGELRADHWHMGLDIRTQRRINLPVHAAAGGYISHIGIRSHSFGQFIIIHHPNGLSTLYAHLHKFFPALEKFINEQQYKQETWAIELDFSPTDFPVEKGDLIAYSGNTGGSLGPHLHFEIFDTKTTKRLNPQVFNLPIADHTPPTLTRLALYDRSKSLYEQNPRLFLVKKLNGVYQIPKTPVIKTGLTRISFGIQATDKADGGGSPNGIYAGLISIDSIPQVSFELNNIDYNETVYVNAQIDYKHDYNGGVYIQHLSQLPGDRGPVYKKINSDGVINLTDTAIHQVEIKITDVNGNTSLLNFAVQYDDSIAEKKAGNENGSKIIPHSVHLMGKPGFEMLFPINSIYDTIIQTYTRSNTLQGYEVSFAHTVNAPTIPLHQDVTVKIKPDKIVPEDWKERIIIQKKAKGSQIRKASWENGWLVAKFGGFGIYQAFADVISPTINELGKGDTINLSAAKNILFTPKDNFGVIKNFRAELDGKWICFTNDKGRNWIYTFDERCPYGVHELKVTVQDLVGNTTTKSWWFRRNPYTPPVKKRKR